MFETFRLVILESPYAAPDDRTRLANINYARKCMRDCLERMESPYASHLLFTQSGILDDQKPSDREWGIRAGLAWARFAEATVVYVDRGISTGMKVGILQAEVVKRPVEYRKLPHYFPNVENEYGRGQEEGGS